MHTIDKHTFPPRAVRGRASDDQNWLPPGWKSGPMYPAYSVPISALLHEIGPAFEVFSEHQIHLISQAANDLNLSVVVERGQAATSLLNPVPCLQP